MPTYLLHGFRWPRGMIRVHVIMQNIDDAAPEWLMAPATPPALIENFQQLYPHIMELLPTLRFIEQYDPLDITLKSQPFAYVADVVHEVKLGLELGEVCSQQVDLQQTEAFIRLRDALCNNEKVPITWYVVVCGDLERDFPESSSRAETPLRDSLAYTSGATEYAGSSQWSKSQYAMSGSTNDNFASRRERSSSISRSFRKVFGMKGSGRNKSLKDLQISEPDETPPLPLPGTAQ